MKELHIDRFDALISLASAECVKEEADLFLASDISGIEDNPRMLRKILGASRHQKHKPLKIFLLVALLCMSIAFTACMLVPEIRHAIWNVLVRDHDDHVEIEFDSEETGQAASEEAARAYPQTIEDKMVVTYVPEGCVKGEEIITSSQYKVYYSMGNESWKFFVAQSIIEGTNSFINDNSGQLMYVDIDNSRAVFIEYYKEKAQYSLTWQDNLYRYTIFGSFDSINEIIKIAQSIKTN